MAVKNDRAVVCKHWLRGLCKKGDMCEFLHEFDMSKMPECYFFTQYNECTNEDCLYLHITNKERVSVCQFYARGFCRHGGACRNRHDMKVLCERYARGFCPLGPSCDYGHPEFDASHDMRNVECHICGKFGHKALDCEKAEKVGGGEKPPGSFGGQYDNRQQMGGDRGQFDNRERGQFDNRDRGQFDNRGDRGGGGDRGGDRKPFESNYKKPRW